MLNYFRSTPDRATDALEREVQNAALISGKPTNKAERSSVELGSQDTQGRSRMLESRTYGSGGRDRDRLIVQRASEDIGCRVDVRIRKALEPLQGAET